MTKPGSTCRNPRRAPVSRFPRGRGPRRRCCRARPRRCWSWITCTAPKAPLRTMPKPPAGPEPAAKITDDEWLALDYDELQKNLAGQKARAPRIRVPTLDEYARANPDAPPRKLGIKWSLVCSAYQPKL